MPPRVTVIIATYNRSNLLGYAIRSVLWQTLPDFEVLVVGDGCTDDTAEVVAAFGDARVQWHNLPENSGSQSAPNNYGLEHAQGKYIAYLGHDDLWYPTHLEMLVRALDQRQAAIAHSLCVRVGWEGIRSLTGVPNETYLQPYQPFVPPSSVMHLRSLTDKIGLWYDYRSIDDTPDRNFFDRARAAGARIAAVTELTCFKFPAAWRPDSYVQDFSAEQETYLRRIHEEADFLYREAIAIAEAYVLGKTAPAEAANAYNPSVRHPGWKIERTRRVRGLEARPTPRPTLRHYREALVIRVKVGLLRIFPFLRRRR